MAPPIVPQRYALHARAVASVALLFSAAACSGGHDRIEATTDAGSVAGDAGPSSSVAPAVCPPENPYCTSAPPKATDTCGNQPIDLTPVGVNIMVAIDGSFSMNTHWKRIQDAVRSLRASHPNTALGVHVFWGQLAESYEEGKGKNNYCGKTNNRVLDVGNHGADDLVSFLGNMAPGQGFFNLWETSPVVEPLNYYLKNAGKLADPASTNYLLFITDGNDNCFGSLFTSQANKLVAYQKLAIELQKLNIRTIPIGFDAASAADTSNTIFAGTTPANTNLEVLEMILKNGGSGLQEVPKVDNASKLGEVIEQVGQKVRNCRFAIPAALDPTAALNPFELSFTVNGTELKRDRMNKEGWNFIDGNTSQVELFGQACEAVRAGAKLESRKTCGQNVCGTAAVKVETKPRAVLALLDSSASRIECVDGSLNCLSSPVMPGIFAGLFPPRVKSFWEVVQQSLAVSLAAPINDDIEFGLQFFPGKRAADFSCDVASEPEIPPAQGTEITMLSQMLEKLPFGFSPVVQVLENVAAAPGRLADADVLGAVVMLTDGGDNCATMQTQSQIVARLGTAAQKLLDQKVQTHVIRYGSQAGKTADQDAQLRAIVAHGGTATSDPSDLSKTPYIDAVTEEDLIKALATISDKLAVCSFKLGNLPDDADKSTANLYLNGEVIPFDAQDSKQDGWGWLDAEQTTVQMYGEACTSFKTNRKTSVVVEFGCAPIPLF